MIRRLLVLLLAQPIVERTLTPRLARFVAWPVVIWMGLLFWVTLVLWASDLLLWLIQVDGVGPERALVVGGVVLAAAGVGLREVWRGPRDVRIEIELTRWPQALDGYRIAQITDIHIGAILDHRFARHLTERRRMTTAGATLLIDRRAACPFEGERSITVRSFSRESARFGPDSPASIRHEDCGSQDSSMQKHTCTHSATAVGGAREVAMAKPEKSEKSRESSAKLQAIAGDIKAKKKKIDNEVYEKELARLQIELVKLQEWVKHEGQRIVVIFEGRDAAGKGGVIKRITESLNPRICRVVALGTPTEREKQSWYFQRYVPHLPAAGEIVLFDRSWYNRAGVERVMGFCTDPQYQEFLRSCPEFERMLVRADVQIIKYWFSVSDAEQERRFQRRMDDPTRSWKLSPMDVESRSRWIEYSQAKDEMFKHTDIKQAPWYVVNADSKKRARLNCITHLLSQIDYKDLTPSPPQLPPRPKAKGYVRPPIEDQNFVPEIW